MQKDLVAVVSALLIISGGVGFAAEGDKVLAKVGEETITLQEFTQMLPMLSVFNLPGDSEAGKRKLLETLVNQLLFAREAIRMGLDQTSLVKAGLNQARTNILAQAYINQRTQGISIGDKEVRAFFESHRGEFQGKEMKDVEVQIKAKLLQEATGDLIKKAKTELWRREKVVLDEQLLKQVEVPQRSMVNP